MLVGYSPLKWSVLAGLNVDIPSTSIDNPFFYSYLRDKVKAERLFFYTTVIGLVRFIYEYCIDKIPIQRTSY